MRHLRSLVLAGVALAGLIPAGAFASQARIDVNVIHYPSTIVRYQNLVYGDLGIKNTDGGDLTDFEDNIGTVPGLENSARSMGAHLKLWKNMPGVLGVQLNENATPLSPAYGADHWNRNRNEGVTLLWGHDFGGITGGLQFNRTSSSTATAGLTSTPANWAPAAFSPTVTNSRAAMNSINAALGAEPWNTTGFGGGVSFDWDAYGRRHTADIGVQYRTMSYERELVVPGGTILNESDGNYGIALNARTQFATSDNTYLVPVFNYWSMNLDNRLVDGITPGNDFEAANDVSGWNMGVAESWVLREQDLLTLGFQFGQEDIEYNDARPFGAPFSATYTTTPALFGALEVHPMNWFHVRLGASKAIVSKTEFSNLASATTTELSDSPFGYTMGVGFRIGGRLDIDAVVNQDYAFTGSWLASGNAETPFSRLSATYRF